MTPLVLICVAFLASDGDSGRCVTADGERHRVRLAGVDAGEVLPHTRCRRSPDVWACSPVAKANANQAGRRARYLTRDGARCTVTDTDRYQRSVAVCTVDGRDLGGQLVREGLAISDPLYGDQYRSEEDAARRERLGVWR